MNKSQVGIRGFVKAVVTRADGSSYVHLDEQNTIHANYRDEICNALMGASNIALDNVFDGNATPPPNGEDGIAIKDNGGVWYEMDCDTTSPVQSGFNTVIVGVFTGVAIDITVVGEVALGHNFNASVPTTTIANPTTWPVLNLLATETLTITWTIKHGYI